MLTTQQEDLLQAAFGPGDSAAASWRRWRASVDWNAHLDRDSFRLMPRTSRRLHELGVDDPVLPRLTGIARQTWYANQRVVARWQPVLRVLAAANVDPLLVPAETLLLLDGRPVLDQSGEFIRLAVRREHAQKAILCLWNAGWRASAQIPRWSLTGYVAGGHRLWWSNDKGSVLELLWQWDPAEPLGRFPSGVWERTAPARLADVAVRIPDATDAIHDYCRQPFDANFFARAVDLLLMMDTLSGDIDWQRLAARAAHAPLLLRWHDGFAKLRLVLPELFSQSALIEWPQPSQRAVGQSRGDLRARMEGHWAAYRQALGMPPSAATAIGQLPGYLLGRWNLPDLRSIPMRFVRGLRWEWRDAQFRRR